MVNKSIDYWLTLLCACSLLPAGLTIKWLALVTGAGQQIRDQTSCDSLLGLINRQKTICRRYVDVMGSVRTGASIALGECQFQFHNRRWNCSMHDAINAMSKSAVQRTREVAYLHAVSAAGVSYAVTRACSAGLLTRCGCDRTVKGDTNEGFQWSGCSDNIAYGNAFSRNFVDSRERTRKGRATRSGKALVNLHNNQAGREVMLRYQRTLCKCHGVSGSCELKTCWKAMPTFRRVGSILKDKFDSAILVRETSRGSRKVLVPVNENTRQHAPEDLVYIDESPDYCRPSNRTGSVGTTGRVCNATSRALDGCQMMCCDRGSVTRARKVYERCHCKFEWCCKVICKTCVREIQESTCK